MSVTYRGLSWFETPLRRCGFQYYDRVTEVHLSGKKYTDSIIQHVTRFPHLQKLSLNKTEITSEGLAMLKKRLSGCEIILY